MLDPSSKQQHGSTPPALLLPHTRPAILDAAFESSRLVKQNQEAELHAVEKRCLDSHLQSKPCVPTGSRFHEVLRDNPHFAARNSLLSKLELNLPVNFEVFIDSLDGNSSALELPTAAAAQNTETRQSDNSHTLGHDHLKFPSTDCGAKYTTDGARLPSIKMEFVRNRGFSSSKDGDETAEMWKRAMRAESISRSPRCSTSTQSVSPQPPLQDDAIIIQVPRAPCPSEIGGRSGSRSIVHSPTCTELPTQNDEETFRQSLINSNAILEDWDRQIGEQERDTHGAHSGSRCIYKNSVTPPASWARFPSQTRNERNAAASELDSVKPRDFAVREVSTLGSIIWTTDKGDDGAPSQKAVVRSVSDKFTQSIKSRWSKLNPKRVVTNLKDRSIQGARRSSIQASGDLEYPELELLPTAGGYKDLLALEREINEMKGSPDQRRQPSSDNSGQRRSLVGKMTGVLQHDGSADIISLEPSRMVDFVEGQTNSMEISLPRTPATQTAARDRPHDKEWTGSSGERYTTPFTHFTDSRPPTPQATLHIPVLAHTGSSNPSASSIIRHTSLYARKYTPNEDTNMSTTLSESPSSPSHIRRRSAPAASIDFD